ncbi:MAG: FG-GAP-like repeat-containing protein [Bacteroidales bacterium]|nr:FG-GAP-like repeat-containing protein [Bacteroidales bacterium]
MKLIKLLIILLISTNFVAGQELMEEVECASYDADSKTYVLSCWGNGKIIKIGEDRIPVEFLDVGAHALGSTVYNNVIYVSLGTSIKGFDFDTELEVFNVNVSGSHQLDGMNADSNGNLYVADFHYAGSDDYIWKIDLSTGAYEIFAEDGLEEGLQDVIVDEANNRLIVVSYYENTDIQAVDMTTGEVTALVENSVGNYDGVAMDTDGNLYLSSGEYLEYGDVIMYDASFQNPPVVIDAHYLGPANLCYNPDRDELCVPILFEHKAVFIKLIDFEEHTIDNSFASPAGMFIYDVDSDGNEDIIGAGADGGIVVYYNDGNSPISWNRQIVDDTFDTPLTVFAADINGDDNIDLISGSWGSDGLVWWENDGSQNWTKHDIDTETDNIHEVFVADLNNDNYPDVLIAAAATNEISWYENDENQNWTKHIIANDFMGSRSVYACDFDNDGDIDLAGAALLGNDIRWWRNEGGNPIVWSEYLITDEFIYAHKVDVADYDFDGDYDIIGTAYTDGITWWRNNGGDPIIWSEHIVDDTFAGAVIASGADFDADGDYDVAGTSQGQHDVSWWRNKGYPELYYTEQSLNNSFAEAWPMYAKDIDGDGDVDIAAGGNNANAFKWWENDLFPDANQAPVAHFTADFNNICVNSTVTFHDFSYGDITAYEWDFGEDANPLTANTVGPHEVTYSTEGEKIVSLSVSNSFGTYTKTIIINAVTELVIEVEPADPLICDGGSVVLVASGADDFIWSPPDGLSSTTGSAVIASPSQTTTYTVTGTQGTCTGSSEITVYITENENDDICDAISVIIGTNGPFSNRCASAEANEPVPPLTGCTGQLSWCNEGGVQNSLWFTVVAPESGRISVAAPGFDNQIALYEADNCNDLFTGSYTLLAANDDYDTNDFSAKLTDVNGLTPDDIYWLQVDGSAGGQTGEFEIIVTELPAVSTEQLEKDKIEINPNPNNGFFEIKSKLNLKGEIQIYSIDGKKIYTQKTDNLSGSIQIDISNYPPGIYNLLFINDEFVFTEILIKH